MPNIELFRCPECLIVRGFDLEIAEPGLRSKDPQNLPRECPVCEKTTRMERVKVGEGWGEAVRAVKSPESEYRMVSQEGSE